MRKRGARGRLLRWVLGPAAATAACVRDAALPSAPALPTWPSAPYTGALPPGPFTRRHASEFVTQHRPAAAAYPGGAAADARREACPHEQAGLLDWHDGASWEDGVVPTPNGSPATLAAGAKVLLSSCSLLPGGGAMASAADGSFGIITVPASSELIFADAPIALRAAGIVVEGALRVGSASCPFRAAISVTLTGARPSPKPAASDVAVKGVYVTGTLDAHGTVFHPTWTRLAATAAAGERVLLVQDRLNWRAGARIVLTTTAKKDARDWHENEELTVAEVLTVPSLGSDVTALTLTAPLAKTHYGGFEYQAEVGLLSRNVLIQGDELSEPTDATPLACSIDKDDSETAALAAGFSSSSLSKRCSTFPCDNHLTGFGAHVMVAGSVAVGRVSGVEFFRVGQTNVVARYPFHLHHVGAAGAHSYIRSSSVHRSYYRCITVHGTHNATVRENVAYDAIGHCYYLEDGVEEDNDVSFNLAAHVHTMGAYWRNDNYPSQVSCLLLAVCCTSSCRSPTAAGASCNSPTHPPLREPSLVVVFSR